MTPQPAFDHHSARFSRRQALRAGTLWAVAAVGLAACQGSPGQATPSSMTPSATAEPAAAATSTAAGAVSSAVQSPPAGVLKVAYTSLQPSFDPHNWGGSSGPFTFGPMFDALTYLDENGALNPWLATSWNLVDPTTWQFKLRDGVKFQNGEAFDADSVKFSYERVIDPANKLGLTGLVSTVTRVDIVDPLTVNIVTSMPDPILPRRANLVYMLPAGYFNQAGLNGFLNNPVGTGAWAYDQFVKDQKAYFTAFPSSWRGAPKMGKLQIDVLAQEAPRRAALQSGEVDIAVDIDSDQAKSLQAAGFSLLAKPIGRIQPLELDMTSGPFADLKVRQAMTMAIDRNTIIQQIFQGFGKLAKGQLVGEGAVGYNPAVDDYPFDPAQAKELLQQAGYGNGFQTEIQVLDNLKTTAEAIGGYWSNLGVQLSVNVIDFPTFIDHVYNGGRGPVYFSASDYGLLMDADQAYFRFSTAVPPQQRWANDSEFSDLFLKTRAETDETNRAQLLNQVAQQFHDKALGIPIFQWIPVVGMTRSVQGVQVLPNGAWWFDQALKT
jgi:peptide/nickel transport system substrate-binding protein